MDHPARHLRSEPTQMVEASEIGPDLNPATTETSTSSGRLAR